MLLSQLGPIDKLMQNPVVLEAAMMTRSSRGFSDDDETNPNGSAGACTSPKLKQSSIFHVKKRKEEEEESFSSFNGVWFGLEVWTDY